MFNHPPITLLIARHGNTFGPDDTPTRVGARTDLPLVESGRKQAKKLGFYLKENSIVPDAVYTSTLKRTIETAQIALNEAKLKINTEILSIFDEIDYGPDENKTEKDVIARIGEQAIRDWNDKAIVPNGWKVNPQNIVQGWNDFAQRLIKSNNQTILVVTSNGTARFAPYLTNDFEGFRAKYPLKLSTGALGIITYKENRWFVDNWNIKPLNNSSK